LHDSSEDEHVRRCNQAAALTKLLVPALRTQGYRFVAVDETPQVRQAIDVARGATLTVGGSCPMEKGRDPQ
jgi:hypothetical protein